MIQLEASVETVADLVFGPQAAKKAAPQKVRPAAESAPSRLRPERSRPVVAPDEYRVDGVGGALYVFGPGLKPEPVDTRREGEERVRELREAAEIVPVLDCWTLWRLELGGAPHDPDAQDPHDPDFTCACVRPNRSEGLEEFGTVTYPARMDDPGACRCGNDYEYRGVRVRLCCSCGARVSSRDFAQAIEILAGRRPSTVAEDSDSQTDSRQAGERPAGEVQSLPEPSSSGSISVPSTCAGQTSQLGAGLFLPRASAGRHGQFELAQASPEEPVAHSVRPLGRALELGEAPVLTAAERADAFPQQERLW